MCRAHTTGAETVSHTWSSTASTDRNSSMGSEVEKPRKERNTARDTDAPVFRIGSDAPLQGREKGTFTSALIICSPSPMRATAVTGPEE